MAKDAEIERLKALCARAADALAGCTWQARDAMIAELRKAAELRTIASSTWNKI